MRSVALKRTLEFAPDDAPASLRSGRVKGRTPLPHSPEEVEAEELLAEMRRDASQDPRGYVLRWEVRGGGE